MPYQVVIDSLRERIAQLEAELAYWHEEFHCKDAETARLEVKNIGAEQMVRTILRLDSGGVIGDPQAQDIRERLKRLVTVEAELVKEKNRADGHCLSADYLREKCGQLEALASSHFADLAKAWEKLKETEAKLEVSKASEAASERAFRTLHKNFLFWQDQAGIECKRAEDLKTKSVEAREESNVRLSKIELLEGKLLTARQQLAASQKLAADRLCTIRELRSINVMPGISLGLAQSWLELLRKAEKALAGLVHQHPNGCWYDYSVPISGAAERAGKALAQIRAALPKEDA